jgi:anti-anti-sigma factor
LTMLERQLDDAIARRATSVDLVLTSVQVIDSAGLIWLLSAKSRLDVAGIGFKLVEPSAIVADILVATRLDTRFTIESPAATGERNA